MQDKQKVTLYLAQGIHRQLKIKAAVETESMSALVEKALKFYLQHPDKVEEIEAATYGKTHQVHICPECAAAMVARDGEMVSLKNQPSVIGDEFSLEVRPSVSVEAETEGEESLVPC